MALYQPVLSLAAETIAEWEHRVRRPVLRVAGLVGSTHQALGEARTAGDLGYHLGILSLGALPRASDTALIAHCRAVAQVIPLMGFYLQPAVGGRDLSYRFWRRFVEIENVVAIKIAPFNRYATIDVLRAVADAGREREIALYTGNDDNIVADLVTGYRVRRGRKGFTQARMVGGLLGHWAYWTQNAVALLDRAGKLARRGASVPTALLRLGAETTDANGAIFDAGNRFRGCIPGIHEVLRRQGLLRGRWCLDPLEELSPGQMAEIDRVLAAYPHLADDRFVESNLDRWLA